MDSKEEIITKLREHFPESVFHVYYDKEKELFLVTRDMVITNKETREVEEKNIHCLEFTIDEENREVVIKLLLNCSIDLEYLGRGKDIIDRIIKFSKVVGYNTRIEYDVSKISVHGVAFSLRELKLLSSGKTWYQSLGFYENNYVKNKACINNYIDNNFIKDEKTKVKKTLREYYSKIMSDIQSYSKQETLDNETMTMLKKIPASMHRRFKIMENKDNCPGTYENFHDLIYMDREPEIEHVSASKKQSNSSSSSRKSLKSINSSVSRSLKRRRKNSPPITSNI